MIVFQILLAILAVLLAPVLGALISGLDRRLTARIQGRMGPPILQPLYDVLKLLAKDPICTNGVQIIYVLLHLAFMVVAIFLLVMQQDILMILLVHAFSTIALILGGMSVRSPYSRIGSQRKIMQLLAYEPVLILLVVAIYKIRGSFMIEDMTNGAGFGGSLLYSMPLLFLAYLMVMEIKMDKSPFDVATSHHAHQELVKGITLEYSGPYLAIIEITHFMETALLFVIIGLLCLPSLMMGLLLAAASFVLLIILDNAVARLTTTWMVKFMWTTAMVLAVANIAWLYL